MHTSLCNGGDKCSLISLLFDLLTDIHLDLHTCSQCYLPLNTADQSNLLTAFLPWESKERLSSDKRLPAHDCLYFLFAPLGCPHLIPKLEYEMRFSWWLQLRFKLFLGIKPPIHNHLINIANCPDLRC